MGVTVAIPTYNRAHELRLTLSGLSRLDLTGAPEYEILVVGNNCTDDTRAAVEEHAPKFHGLLRYVEEPTQGLSHARNRAIAEARHGIVAFLDDDVEVDRNWLAALWTAYGSGDYAAVGGKAYLIYPGSRPAWLSERLEGWLTKVDRGPHRRMARPDELYGLNVSFRKEWIDRVGWFRTDQGRVGTCLLGGEETELLRRIDQAGGALLYEPGAVVGHRVAPERLRRKWFWSRCYWGAVGDARLLPDEEISLYALLRRTWHIARNVPALAYRFFRHGPGSEQLFYQSTVLMSRFGAWMGLASRLHRRPRPTPCEVIATAKQAAP
jgi:glycosyltransferase involved in cell wall biosynthesis